MRSHCTFTKVILVDSNLSNWLKVFCHHDDCFLPCEHKQMTVYYFLRLLHQHLFGVSEIDNYD